MEVTINVCRADLNPEECQRYIEGHQKVLAAYGVSQVTSADLRWAKEPYTYLVNIDSIETGEILGGARVQLANGTLPLPIETAINNLDPRIYDMVREKAKKRTAEYCGLWNSRKVAGYGIGSIILGRVGSAILDQLNLGSIFAFGSPATLPLCKRVGYKVITSLGNNGTFYYPKEDLLATALIIDDPLELKSARPGERTAIFDLRKKPIQTTVANGPKGEIKIEYNLLIEESSLYKTLEKCS